MESYTSERMLRKEVIEICRRMYDKGFIAATDGNVSVKMSSRRILVTPSGVHKGYLKADQLVVVDQSGQKISGVLNASSEIQMHLGVYAARPDVHSVVHAHPPLTIAFSIAGVSLAQCVVPEVIVSLGAIPTAPYATPTTSDVPKILAELILRFDAIILDRHGSLTLGATLEQAYNRLETMEHTAKITLAAKQLGQVRTLPKDEVDRLIAMGEKLGLTRAYTACSNCGICDIDIAGASFGSSKAQSQKIVPSSPCAGSPNAKHMASASLQNEQLVQIIREEMSKLIP